MIDLDAIRQRNERRKVHDTEADPSFVNGERGYINGKRDDDYDRETSEFYESACADIDSLLDEDERLRGENEWLRGQLTLDENFRAPEFGGCGPGRNA
jgi:hypothetical protein